MKSIFPLLLALAALAEARLSEEATKQSGLSLDSDSGKRDFLQSHPEHGHGGHSEEAAHEEHGHAGHEAAPVEHAPAEHGGHGHGGHVKVEDGEAVHEQSGRIVVYGLGCTVVLLAFTFAMTQTSNLKVSNATWRTLDNVINIFLAVLVFQAIDTVVYDSGLIPEGYATAGSAIYAILVLSLAIGIAYTLRASKASLAVFVGCSAHFVSFAFMHAATLPYEHHTHRVDQAAIVFFIVLAVVPAILTALHFGKKAAGMSEHDDLMERTDDLENDAGAMGVAISWTILVCYILTGEFHDVEATEEANRHERDHMLYYAIAVSLAGGILVIIMSNLEHTEGDRNVDYFKRRLGEFGSSFVAMCAAWAWLLWGKWYFHEHAYEGRPMFSRILFAFYCSLAAMAAIVCVALLPGSSSRAKKEKGLVLLCVALMAGWAWEETFDAGIEILAEEHESHKKAYKLGCAMCMLGVVLPVHVIYFKPIVVNLPEDGDEVDAK